MNLLSTITDRLKQVTEDGDGLMAVCPAHNDHEPSLRVSVTEEGKVLMVCRAGCTWAEVTTAIGVDQGAYFNVTSDVEGIKPASSSPGDLPVEAQALLGAYLAKAKKHLGADALVYVARRFGVSPTLAGSLGLGYDDGTASSDFPWVGEVYKSSPRVVVPFRDFSGVPRGFQSRDITDNGKVKWAGPSNPRSGGSWAKWGFMDSGSGQDFIMLTEGPGDALSSVAAGVDAVLIRGSMVAAGAAQDLVEPLKGRRVILGGDNDKAGRQFNDALGAVLTEAGVACHVIALPEGMGDLSEWQENTTDFSSLYQAAVFRAAPWVRTAEKEQEQEDALVQLNTSDVGVARLVLEFFNGRLAYTPGMGFFLYEDGVWSRDELNRTRLTIYEVADYYTDLAQEYKDKGTEADDAMASSYIKAANRLSSTKVIDQVTKELQVLSAITLDRYDRQPRLLCVKNGVINLKDGMLLPHSPDYYLTQKVDVDYDDGATAPRWESFLREVFPGDPDGLPAYLQRLVGYGITGETVEQCFAVLWGRGANGKSVFTDTLSSVFEGITKTTPFSTFEEKVGGGIPNDVAALRGARLVFASEGEQGKPMAESVIKRVTGQDLITARFMREEFFSFRPSFLIFLATNHKPSFRSMDAGLWRRVKLLPWARFFEEDERDHYLTHALKSEAEGILNWAVQGAMEWDRRGLGDPATVVTATKTYRDTSDRLAGFYPDILRDEKGNEILAADAFRRYVAWCEQEELPTKEIWSRNAFYQAIEERGVDRVKRTKGMTLLDVTLEPSPVAHDDPDLDLPYEAHGGAR